MIVKTYKKLGLGMTHDLRVEFSPNEPGTPFGDNLAHQVSSICRQFGDSSSLALPPIRLLPVTNSEFIEVMEKGGDLITVGLD
jgi:hypothetical protein